ncbi:hypothetical protein HF680_10465 [Brevundimonas sp. WCHBH090558]|uniref:hypothetical protein n=1 Tax=Brevundimonas huaxiensis TaxID=2725493 RepID=UPI001626411F|nr:hypothetical protein [Brevundimonas huaxiensis]MBC1183074.1 hypothetical protein [Brevundimonas huaxiensis]
MDEFRRDDPNVIIPIASTLPRVEETIIVERESTTGWWLAALLGAIVIGVALWLFTRPSDRDPSAELRLAQAEAAAADAQATAQSALLRNSEAEARDSIALAQAQAMAARAEADRAIQQARVAQARAAEPVVIERQTVVRPASSGDVVIAPTSPQP